MTYTNRNGEGFTKTVGSQRPQRSLWDNSGDEGLDSMAIIRRRRPCDEILDLRTQSSLVVAAQRQRCAGR
ncbi:MAG TPA: hypothetical protein VGX94_05765, partial [Terriglobia bacterium]|nr:hypothetical protein [Terriglobia bacterium]